MKEITQKEFITRANNEPNVVFIWPDLSLWGKDRSFEKLKDYMIIDLLKYNSIKIDLSKIKVTQEHLKSAKITNFHSHFINLNNDTTPFQGDLIHNDYISFKNINLSNITNSKYFQNVSSWNTSMMFSSININIGSINTLPPILKRDFVRDLFINFYSKYGWRMESAYNSYKPYYVVILEHVFFENYLELIKNDYDFIIGNLIKTYTKMVNTFDDWHKKSNNNNFKYSIKFDIIQTYIYFRIITYFMKRLNKPLKELITKVLNKTNKVPFVFLHNIYKLTPYDLNYKFHDQLELINNKNKDNFIITNEFINDLLSRKILKTYTFEVLTHETYGWVQSNESTWMYNLLQQPPFCYSLHNKEVMVTSFNPGRYLYLKNYSVVRHYKNLGVNNTKYIINDKEVIKSIENSICFKGNRKGEKDQKDSFLETGELYNKYRKHLKYITTNKRIWDQNKYNQLNIKLLSNKIIRDIKILHNTPFIKKMRNGNKISFILNDYDYKQHYSTPLKEKQYDIFYYNFQTTPIIINKNNWISGFNVKYTTNITKNSKIIKNNWNDLKIFNINQLFKHSVGIQKVSFNKIKII